ncbi:serine/threonine-protein kinase [Glycomyces buryatensis]|uniref:non-specific serine/threonine protein kinase n=1 Tax=Glycomyces buryatensis TaxID=2570927 RepID=A0A4V6T6R2_9ACTN|nr:serine/threonine-protein kinase [Glycomyces buryatensis]THV42106.1 serine/threonine protein kinase [Glycomyces buryatensis]
MLSTRNLKAGDVLDGRYRLERRVGGGGMGDVWEGTDTILWRTVAIKILLADLVDDRGFRERFRREARAIAVMKGPGVVEVYDYGEIEHEDAQIAYLIMEFVDGKPLSRLLGLWGKLGSADALRVIGGVAEALQVAHAAGIVHRDIKPGNILVRADGSVVLVDFGIARVNHNLTLTTTGVVLGTVTYMSPEQAAGENLTAASDLYSLGIVAHQCLAGSPPFKADTPLGVLSAHLRNPPPPLPVDIPVEVTQIVRRALEKEPSARWENAAEFAQACSETRAAMIGPAPRAANPPTRVQQPRPRPEPMGAMSPTGGARSVPVSPVSPVSSLSGQYPLPPVTGQHPIRYRTGQHQIPSSSGQHRLPPQTGQHQVPSHTGAHRAPSGIRTTGSHPVSPPPAPPTTPGQVASAEERPKRRRLWITLAGTLAAIAAVSAVAAAGPWERLFGDGAVPAGETAPAEADVQGQDADDPDNGSEGDAPDNPDAPDHDPSATGEDDTDASGTQSPSAGTGPSQTESTLPSTSPSTSPSAAPKATVPGVVGQTESEARQHLEESDLATSVVYEGEGEARCGVVRQNPSAGTEVAPDSTVQITVERAADAASCRTEEGTTEAPAG